MDRLATQDEQALASLFWNRPFSPHFNSVVATDEPQDLKAADLSLVNSSDAPSASRSPSESLMRSRSQSPKGLLRPILQNLKIAHVWPQLRQIPRPPRVID